MIGMIGMSNCHHSPFHSQYLYDRNFYGWWCWPRTMKVYLPGSAKFEGMFLIDNESQDAIASLKETFNKPEFWKKQLEYAGQETTPIQANSSRGGGGAPEENFSFTVARLYKSIFQFFEDGFFYDIVAPTLEKWLHSEEKSQIRAAAEICAGVIRSMKLWSWSKQTRFWNWMMPHFKSALLDATPETMVLWNHFLYCVCVRLKERRWSSHFVGQPRSTAIDAGASVVVSRQGLDL